MKILIVSDSHGHSELLDDLVCQNKDVEIFLHAGDSEVPPHTLYPFRVVKGNCDYYFDTEKEYIIPTPFGNLLIRHKEDASQKYLKDNDIKFYVYGHTHVKTCKKKYGVAYINPGSICYPRDKEASYAILEVDENEAYCSFYALDTKKLLKKYRVYIGLASEFEAKQKLLEENQEPSLEEITTTVESAVKAALKEEMNNKGE